MKRYTTKPMARESENLLTNSVILFTLNRKSITKPIFQVATYGKSRDIFFEQALIYATAGAEKNETIAAVPFGTERSTRG